MALAIVCCAPTRADRLHYEVSSSYDEVGMGLCTREGDRPGGESGQAQAGCDSAGSKPRTVDDGCRANCRALTAAIGETGPEQGVANIAFALRILCQVVCSTQHTDQ